MANREVHPFLAGMEMICAETPTPPTAITVFGASGDLARRKLLPSLAQIQQRGLLHEQFCLLGCGRTEYSDEQFRELAASAIRENSGNGPLEAPPAFLEKLYYLRGEYDDPSTYERLKTRLTELRKKHGIDRCDLFYLSVPPLLYETIIEHLGAAGFSWKGDPECHRRVRLMVEKPFGRDLRSATQLNNVIAKWFEESQVYRIDHYLGKETVQNIMIFRFANAIFEPIWGRNHIDNVQITIAETLGVEHRASYYDQSGALRDIFQNHMLQMLALVAMEPPNSFDADQVRDEKIKLLRAVRPFVCGSGDLATGNPSAKCRIVRGQYGPGRIGGGPVPGYRQEGGVAPGSRTETFVAARLLIDNWRWKDVPFYLRTGKRLARKDTEIAVTFKEIPHSLFGSVGLEQMPPNVLIFRIQPEEGISLRFQAKHPGSKICIGTLKMTFSYKDLFGMEMPEAYQRLLLDCMLGDQTLFTRFDGIEVTWRLLMPVLEAWQNHPSGPAEYAAGSESFPQADALVEADGRQWRRLGET
ncbi:MAG: glucose-6-phosphate dehydrogenase [Planctomycetes bacterium]|jgi:glucose-6-phosphate 1-dehydrogenase|nr:glucose-6-phosphate dehydrogenase [Planctomycetota bacterium]